MNIGRRIVYDSVTGKIICNTGEMSNSDIATRPVWNGCTYIDLPYGQDLDKFSRAKKYHIDVVTKQVIFDELYNITADKDAEIASLQQQLLQAQGVI